MTTISKTVVSHHGSSYRVANTEDTYYKLSYKVLADSRVRIHIEHKDKGDISPLHDNLHYDNRWSIKEKWYLSTEVYKSEFADAMCDAIRAMYVTGAWNLL